MFMRFPTYFFSFLLVCFVLGLSAQSGQRTTVRYAADDAASVVTFRGEQPYLGQLPFFAYFLEWDAPDTKAAIRFSETGTRWTDWEALEQDSHNTEKGISTLHFGKPQYRYYQLRLDASRQAGNAVTLHFYQPGVSADLATPAEVPAAASPTDCPCPMPAALARTEWCPGGCPPNPAPSNTNVTHLIVHHSASPNTANDWAAVVRSFWDFHVNGNGWSDIGYNWLIDPNGVVYTGRGNNVLGAHFCAQNTGTAGICVIGDFTNALPTPAAVGSLEQLLAWKTCDIDVDPLGSAFHNSSGRNLMRISGHRDGCSTACPGELFYPTLADVRTGVAEHIANDCAMVATSAPILPATALRLSPNPASSLLQLELDTPESGNLHLRLMDATQRIVRQASHTKSGNHWHGSIDVTQLPSGIYWLQITLADRAGTWKVVVE